MCLTIGGSNLMLHNIFFMVTIHLSLQEEHFVILKSPSNVTVYQDQWADFICRVSGGFQGWEVNGKPENKLPRHQRNDIDTDRPVPDDEPGLNVLGIIARPEYNGTTFHCVINGGLSGRSDIAILTIQGTLSEVGDLQTIYNTSSVVIEWTAPFSLDVTGVDHDIWYSVIMYNVTDENNSTVINCTDCINITDTYYTFTPSHCTMYNISILPINGAGLGNISDSSTVEGINLRRTNIAAIGDNFCKVEYEVECGAHLVESVFLQLYDGTMLPTSVQDGMIEFHLPEKRMYNTSFVVHLIHGKIEFKRKTFTTFDIQNPYAVTLNDNEILVTGELIENSTAIGCFLAIECHYTFKITFIALRKQESQNNISEVIKIQASKYTVYAHDLEEDSLPYIYPSNPNIIPVQVNGNDTENENSGCGDIIQNHETVTVNCTPESEDTSCIVVYRAHGNSTLNLRYNESFPLIITLNNSRTTYYTIALFLITETGYIERTQCVGKMVSITSSVIVTPSIPGVNTNVNQPVEEIAVGATLAVIIIVIISTIAVLHVILLKKKEQLKRHGFNYPTNLYLLYDSCRHCVLNEQGLGGRKQRHRRRNYYSIMEDGIEEVKYAEVETRPGQKPPRGESDRVKYEDIDITATNELARSRNAESGPSSAEPHIMRTQTAILSPFVPFPVTLPDSSVCVSDEPITEELVMSKLYDKSGQWKMIAEVMGFDEDMIDEIDTNDETDEACLQNCVEQWIYKLDGSWEKLDIILTKLDENNLSKLATTTDVCIEIAEEEKSIAHSESYDKEDEVDNMLTTADEDTAELETAESETAHKGQRMMPPAVHECHAGESHALIETTQSGVKEEEVEVEEEEHKEGTVDDQEEESSHEEQGETMAEDEKSESMKSVAVTGAQEKENSQSGSSDAYRSKVEILDSNIEATNIFFTGDEDGSVIEEEEGLHYCYEIHTETAIPAQQSCSSSDTGVLVTGYGTVSYNTQHQKPVEIFPNSCPELCSFFSEHIVYSIMEKKTKTISSEEKETKGVVDEVTHRKTHNMPVTQLHSH